MLLLIALSSFNIASTSDMKDGTRNFFSRMGSGGGYPYQLNSSAVEAVDILNGDIFILTDTQTMTLDATAKEVKKVDHTYARPAVAIKSDRALVYDRDGTRYRVENRSDTITEGQLSEDEKIITAAIGKKGNIAFGTLSDSCTSKLIVINSTYKKRVFVWNCAEYTVSSVALSDYSDPVSQFEYPGTTMMSVHFSDNHNVAAVGDNAAAFLKGLDKNEVVKYGNSTPSSYAFADNGETILMLAQYGSMNNQNLVGYRPYDKAVKNISIAGSRIAVLTEDSVDLYGLGGTLHRRYEATPNSLKALCMGKRAYVYQMGSIVKSHRISRK